MVKNGRKFTIIGKNVNSLDNKLNSYTMEEVNKHFDYML